MIDWACGARELELAAVRKVCGHRDRELRGQGEIGSGDREIVVGAALSGFRPAYDDLPVFQLKFFDRKIRGGIRGLSLTSLLGLGFCRLAAERREIPHLGRIMQQRDLGRVDGDAGNVQSLRKNQWHELHAHLQGFGRQKRRRAEFGIVADGEVFGGQRTAEKRKAQVSQLHLAA